MTMKHIYGCVLSPRRTLSAEADCQVSYPFVEHIGFLWSVSSILSPGKDCEPQIHRGPKSMLFSRPFSKCDSFQLDCPARLFSHLVWRVLKFSEPWLVIFPAGLCIDVLLVLSFQVSEVLSEEKSRLSISGWFHGPLLTRPPTYFEPLIPRSPHVPQDVRINSCCWDSCLRKAVAYHLLFWF